MKFLILVSFLAGLPAWSDCQLHRVLDLHPTQQQVGYREVQAKVDKIKAMSPKKLKNYLEKKAAPVVIGPNQKLFMYNRHHLGSALVVAGIENMCIEITEDLSKLGAAEFWKDLEKRNWVYLFDNQDQPISPDQLPADLSQLKDDPYRSLAWEVSNQGGYEDTEAPFSEFLWARFFRSRIDIGTSDADFDAAVKRGVQLAHSEDAKNLPGWTPKAL